MTRFALLLAALLVMPAFAQSGTTPASESADSPTEVVRRLQAMLLETMQAADTLGYQGRFARLAPSIRDSHDLAAMARVTVGQFWNDWTPDRQRSFVDTFSELSIASYASQLKGYSGETFQILSTEQPDSDNATVHTRLVQPAAEPRRLDYRLRRTSGGWRIVNITYDGISDLALKRSEYASILRREGLDALLARLQQKTAEYANAGR